MVLSALSCNLADTMISLRRKTEGYQQAHNYLCQKTIGLHGTNWKQTCLLYFGILYVSIIFFITAFKTFIHVFHESSSYPHCTPAPPVFHWSPQHISFSIPCFILFCFTEPSGGTHICMGTRSSTVAYVIKQWQPSKSRVIPFSAANNCPKLYVRYATSESHPHAIIFNWPDLVTALCR